MLTALLTVLVWLVHLGFMARAILRPHRDPASRFAWVIVMAVLPLVASSPISCSVKPALAAAA